MSIWIEDNIREAILNVRWKQVGDGPSPNYFVSVLPDSVRLNSSTASWLASFIAKHVVRNISETRGDFASGELDKYSLEVIASYLEDNGYTVYSPE